MTAKATKDAAVVEAVARPEKGQEKDQKKETRSQFESRMRRELQDLFNARMAELMKSQIEATKMTAEAANNLAQIHKNHHQQQPKKRGVRSSSSSGVRGVSGGATTPGLHPGVPEDLKTMISKTESSVPEILSVVEATDRSAKDIQRSIKSAIRELSTNTTGNGNGIPDDETSHNNITEEIAAELTVCKFFFSL